MPLPKDVLEEVPQKIQEAVINILKEENFSSNTNCFINHSFKEIACSLVKKSNNTKKYTQTEISEIEDALEVYLEKLFDWLLQNKKLLREILEYFQCRLDSIEKNIEII